MTTDLTGAVAAAIAAAVRDDARSGPFALHLDPATANVWHNYAVPDIGAEPTPADIEALLEAFRVKDRTPRLEYVPAAAPAVEPALLAAGFTVEGRSPLYGCAPADRVDLSAPPGVEFAMATGRDELLAVARVQKAAYDDPEPAGDAQVLGLEGDQRRGGLVALARSGGEVIGAVQCRPIVEGTSELVGMAVDESHRGRGIAAALAAYVTRAAHDAGATLVWLETEPGLPSKVYGRAGFTLGGGKLWISRPEGRIAAGPARLHPVTPEQVEAILAGDVTGWNPGQGWPHGWTGPLLRGSAPAWLITRDGAVIGQAGANVEDGRAGYAFAIVPAYHGDDLRAAVRNSVEALLRARDDVTSVVDESPPSHDVGPPRIRSGERDTLLAFVNYLREAVIGKLDGLSEADARRSPVGSGTSILGLVKHIADVELSWLDWRFLGGPEPDDRPLGEADTIASVTAGGRAAGARTVEIVAACHDLSTPAARMPEVTMRWILVHLIEEIGRHAGHADIIREQIDGRTGR